MITVNDPEVLRWKRESLSLSTSPIQTKLDEQVGKFVLLKWPDAQMPSQADVDTWETEYAAVKDDIVAEQDIERDKIMRLIFEVNFDQENRLRIQEGTNQVTKQQYKNALISRYKAL